MSYTIKDTNQSVIWTFFLYFLSLRISLIWVITKPFKHQPNKMVKHAHNSSADADELLERVRPFCGVVAQRDKKQFLLYKNYSYYVISLSRDEQICFIKMRFKRYFSHHWARCFFCHPPKVRERFADDVYFIFKRTHLRELFSSH